MPSKVMVSFSEWKLGDWGPCSSSCDIGDQVQRVSCVRTDPRGQSVLVAEDKCTQAVGQKPEYRRSCNENIPCPFWTPLEWSSVGISCHGHCVCLDSVGFSCHGNHGCIDNGVVLGRYQLSWLLCMF